MISKQQSKPQKDIKSYIEITDSSIQHQLQIVNTLETQLDQLYKLQHYRNQIDQTSTYTQNIVTELKQQEKELEQILKEQDELIYQLEKANADEEQVKIDAVRLNNIEVSLIQRMNNLMNEMQNGQNTSLNQVSNYFNVLNRQQ